MARVLVVGYGNPLRCDDGLGWQVAVELFRTNRSPDVEVLPCHQLTPELAASISHFETVLFIDIARHGSPGELRCEEVCPQSGSAPLTHDLSPAALLDMSSELYGACPRAFLLTICGESFEPGESLSPCVCSQMQDLRMRLRELIAESLMKPVLTH